MKSIADLKYNFPQSGSLHWIGIRPVRRAEMVSMDHVALSTEDGLTGDHYGKSGGKRMVTLIQKEHIDVVSQILGCEVNPAMLRRNLVVSGINLLALHNVYFAIGEEVILKGTGPCHPCARMEENLGPGGYNAMRGHGGITAQVVRGGQIRRGYSVTLVVREDVDFT